jgi:hypothetical protein
MELEIISYRAIDDLDLCMEYQKGHIGVIQNLGIKKLTSSKEEWMSNPNMYFSLVYYDKIVVGGVRLQVKDDLYQLPIEAAIDYLDPKIKTEVESRKDNLTGEACGLWIGDEIRNMKMALVLTRNAVVIGRILRLQTMFAFTSQYTLNITKTLGFSPIKDIGNDGCFDYPTKEFISTVCVNDYMESLKDSEPKQKEIIELLASKSQSTLVEVNEKCTLNVKYNFSSIWP